MNLSKVGEKILSSVRSASSLGIRSPLSDRPEVQDQLLEYGVENVAETLIEGVSRVKKCTDIGQALMSLDLQVLINGLQHFVPGRVKLKLQTVETFMEAYYLPETEYVHWARAHPLRKFCALMELVANLPRCYTIKSDKRNI